MCGLVRSGWLSDPAAEALLAMPRQRVLSNKLACGLVDRARHDRLLRQHARDLAMGHSGAVYSDEEEDDEDIPEQQLLTEEEEAAVARARSGAVEYITRYIDADPYRRQIITGLGCLDPHNALAGAEEADGSRPSWTALTPAHVPALDATLRLDLCLHELRTQMAPGTLSNLINSHISQDYDFQSARAAMLLDAGDDGLQGCYAMADPFAPALVSRYSLGLTGLDLQLFPRRRAGAGRAPSAMAAGPAICVGIDQLLIDGPLAPLLTLDRYMSVYNNYFPGSAMPSTLLEAYSITPPGSAMGTPADASGLAPPERTPIIASQRTNPVCPHAALTPFNPCLVVPSFPLTFASQRAPVAASAAIQDMIQSYIFGQAHRFRAAVTGRLTLRPIADEDNVLVDRNVTTPEPEYAVSPQPRTPMYLPTDATGAIAVPAWKQPNPENAYSWLNAASQTASSTPRGLRIHIGNKHKGEDVMLLDLRLTIQGLVHDLVMADKLGRIINKKP
jgi:hypothetical protein